MDTWVAKSRYLLLPGHLRTYIRNAGLRVSDSDVEFLIGLDTHEEQMALLRQVNLGWADSVTDAAKGLFRTKEKQEALAAVNRLTRAIAKIPNSHEALEKAYEIKQILLKD